MNPSVPVSYTRGTGNCVLHITCSLTPPHSLSPIVIDQLDRTPSIITSVNRSRKSYQPLLTDMSRCGRGSPFPWSSVEAKVLCLRLQALLRTGWGLFSRVRCVGWLVFTTAGELFLRLGFTREGEMSCLFRRRLGSLLVESLAVSVLR